MLRRSIAYLVLTFCLSGCSNSDYDPAHKAPGSSWWQNARITRLSVKCSLAFRVRAGPDGLRQPIKPCLKPAGTARRLDFYEAFKGY